MTLMWNGDVLPSVTTAQILMRRHRPQTLITSDGHFGPKTGNAVWKFQDHHTLRRDQIVGPITWHKLEDVSRLRTIDMVDGTDPSLVQMEAADLRKAGFDPIVLFGMSNGLEVAMNEIAARGGNGQTMLLRFHGHGNNGLQNVTGGEINGAPHLAAISLSNFGQIEHLLIRIKRIFAEFGAVQLLGCDVGGGKGTALARPDLGRAGDGRHSHPVRRRPGDVPFRGGDGQQVPRRRDAQRLVVRHGAAARHAVGEQLEI